MLEGPSQADLRYRFVVFLSKRQDSLVGDKPFICSSQWRIGLNGDIVLPAVLDGVLLPEKRVYLKLVDRWLNLRVLKQIFKMMLQEVADANIPDFPFFLELDEGPPGLSSYLFIFGAGDCQFAGPGPVDDQKIEIVYVQAFENVKASFFCFFVALLPWCNFAGNEQFTSVYLQVLEHSPDLFLVFIDAGCVDVCVADFQGLLHCLVALLPSYLVSPETHVRDLVARIEFSARVLCTQHQIQQYKLWQLGNRTRQCC